MRVNVYDHDLTGRVEVVQKVAEGKAVFKGIRFYLGPRIMHTPTDDDTAAVTFWFHQDAQFERPLLIQSFAKALRLLGAADLSSIADPSPNDS
jgi:hypothetical protein